MASAKKQKEKGPSNRGLPEDTVHKTLMSAAEGRGPESRSTNAPGAGGSRSPAPVVAAVPLDSALVEMIAARVTASVTARVTAQLREAASSGSREGGSAQPEGATPRREESRTGDPPAEQHIRETGGKQQKKTKKI